MKNIEVIFLICFILPFRYGYSQDTAHYSPLKIDYGLATFKGRIDGPIPADINIDEINLVIADALTYFKEINVPISNQGEFSIQIPSFGITHGFVNSPIYTGNIFFLPNEETILNISFDDSGNQKTEITEKLGISKKDLLNMGMILGEILADDQKVDSTFGTVKDETDFIRYSSLYMQIAHDQLSKKTEISEAAQTVLRKGITTFFLSQLFLSYYDVMKMSFNNRQRGLNNDGSLTEYRAPEIDSSYFHFLKRFDLNDPAYLYSSYLQPFLADILKNETLDIPKIRTYRVDDWAALVKNKLQSAVGQDNGLFYYLLTANAYVMQLTDLQLLTDSQKNDIKTYFTNKAFVDFLLDENERTQLLVSQNRSSDFLYLHDTPSVPKEQLMDTILAKYKGKVVFVDFWATWCAPCLQAMRESAPVKKAFETKDVAFVYITTTSSPPRIWEDKIKDIGGNHYYLDREQWEYILDSLGVSGIPTYFIYDKQSNQQFQHTMFMGSENMRDWINGLL